VGIENDNKNPKLIKEGNDRSSSGRTKNNAGRKNIKNKRKG